MMALDAIGSAILDVAVRDRRLSSNPAKDVKTPRRKPMPKVYLTHSQVERLAPASRYPDVIRFLAYTGLRWDEATGLRVEHVDSKRHRVRVEENAVLVGSHVEVGTPKTHERRVVPYPVFLDETIRRATRDKPQSALLWPAIEGGYLRQENARDGRFATAVRRVRAADKIVVAEAKAAGREAPPIMLQITPHKLRNTAASLAISAGANVKGVQRMLGPASAAMTLDKYADLFDDDLHRVAEALDEQRRLHLEQ